MFIHSNPFFLKMLTSRRISRATRRDVVYVCTFPRISRAFLAIYQTQGLSTEQGHIKHLERNEQKNGISFRPNLCMP